MIEKDETKINLDILSHLEGLSSQINDAMAPRAQGIFRKYPITFGLLILLGFTALHEGIKGILKDFSLFENHPWYLIIVGLLVLIITGTIYKKLEK